MNELLVSGRVSPEIFREKHKTDGLFPPSFKADRYIYKDNIDGFNCYAYAMQFTTPVQKNHDHYRPGFLVGLAPKGVYADENTVIRGFLGDCEYLGLDVKETTIEAGVEESAYKIIVWYSEYNFVDTFHFTRQNGDGTWSEISKWGKDPEVGNSINEDYYRDEGFFDKKVYSISRKK